MATISQLIFKMLKKNIAILLLLCSFFQVAAQQYYPVVARFTQLPPYPVYLADFSNPAQTNLSIQVQQNDRTIASRPIRIRIYIKGNGFQIQSTEMVQDEPSLILNYGQIYSLPAQQVANYFKQYNLQVSPDQYRQPFNEGAFQFGVEIIDVQTSKPISGVQWANPVWLTVNEPPVWVQPKNEITEKTNTLQNINFQWAPRHNNISNVEYEFSMTELITNNGVVGNVQNLFLAQPTFYKVRTQGTVLNYNATLPPLVAGRVYAYRVQAIAKRGYEDVGVFRNNGFSEVQYFNYGEKLIPPTNLKIAWSENNPKEAILNWKAEDKHKSFNVEIREKNAKSDWVASEIKPQNTGLYNTFTFTNLEPSKNYEARVTGIGEDNQRATSTMAELKLAPIPLKQEELSLKGKVLWAYRASEENVKENMPLSLVADATIRKREAKYEPFANAMAGAKKYALEGAIVTLYSAEEEVTLENYKTKALKRIETVSTNSNGEYTIKGQNIQLLAEVKNLYAIAEFQGAVFSPALMKVQLASNASGTKTLGELTVLANNIRFSPKVMEGNKESALSTDNIEEVALYRLKTSLDKNPYLKQEGNVEGEKPTLLFNNDTYVKVADFGKTSTVAQLFYNKPYNDKFVFRVKQKNRKAVVFPVNDIEDIKEGNYAHITDYFNYTAPNHLISGYVEVKGEKTERLANVSVRVFGQSVRTNGNGYFEIDIPQNTAKNTKIVLSAVDPLNTNNIVSETLVYQLKDEVKTLVINRNAYYVEGRVEGRNAARISGAFVSLRGQSVKTDGDGYFRFVCFGDTMKDSVKISFDGYEDAYVTVKKFKKTDLNGITTEKQRQDFILTLKAVQRPDERFFEENFGSTQAKLKALYQVDSVVLNHETTYRIIAYVNKLTKSGLRSAADSVEIVETVLKIDDNEQAITRGQFSKNEKLGMSFSMDFVGSANGAKKEKVDKGSWTGGYVGKSFNKELVVKVMNKRLVANDTIYTPKYVEEEIKLSLPKKYSKKDTVVLKVRLRPADYFYGTVYDSTTYIKGVHSENDKSVRRPGDPFKRIDSVEVDVSGAKATTNKDGYFSLLVPKGEEFELEISKSGFATSKYTMTAIQAQQHNTPLKARKDLYMLQQEKGIPTFKTLMGFSIKVEKATKYTDKSYLISGVLHLNKGKLGKGGDGKAVLKNIFSAGETTELNFKNIIVKQDTNKSNALTVMNSVNFVETEAKIKLFSFAPITLQGNPIGEPYIRLQHLDVKAATSSTGKIGASEMEFTQREMVGVNFGKMELKVKDPDKDKKFGKFNDKISDKKALQLESQRKEEAALILQMKIQTQKNAVETAQGDAKKIEEKALTNLEGKKYTEAPEKEPLLLAFAPVNLDELADTKEYMIEFPQTATKGDSKSWTAKKDTTEKNDKYKDYMFFAVGNASVLGKGLRIGVDPTTTVLKKSGVVMKGILKFPEIWMFKSGDTPPTIEKLEIDKKFELKSISVGKSDEKKKEIVSFGMADKFMCYLNTIQIYNNFKGYGIGGTINTDKENFVNINSLGLSLINGRVYPNIDLSTPKDGFKISNLRFKTVGKKSISIKGNIDDKSYEIEGSLRIEWDTLAAKNSSTETTDRFGKALDSLQIVANKQLRENEKTIEAENIAFEKVQAQIEERQRKKREEELAIQQGNLASAEKIERRKRLQMYDTDDLKKELEVKRIALEKLKSQVERDREKIAKEEADNIAKREQKIAKEAADKIAKIEQKVVDAKNDSVARKAVENGQQREITSKDKSISWRERVFPIEVQLFKWSTSGKFLVSASPSPDALKFGPVAIKIRRIVFAKGNKGAPVKESEIQDLLKMSEDEIAKMNSTAKFNNANTYVDKEGKRIGATSEENQKTKEGASVDNLSVKAIEDKVSADNPISSAWAFGFAGGVEVDTKGVNVDSDASFYVGDFEKKGVVFKMNEFMLKVDVPALRAYAKVKIATSGKKIGVEGEGEFEGAKIKAALALKWYELYNEKGNNIGSEFGGALKVSTGPTGLIMGPLTWTALGGGFDRNSAEQKFSVFFLGDARSTGVPEKVSYYKNIRVSLDFDGKECGETPVLRGSMQLWSGMLSEKEEKICDVKVDVDFCRTRLVCKIDCDLKFSDKFVKVDALAFVSKGGFFLGAKVRTTMFDMNLNGLLALGILCDTQHDSAPKELSLYTKDLPKYLYQSDNKTLSALYLGVDVSYEKKENGKRSAFGFNVVTYSYEVLLKGKLNAGVNFSNGNFMVRSLVKMESEGKAKILGFNMGGKLELGLDLEGGRTNELGWNFRAAANGKLEIGAGGYEKEACNDFNVSGVKWCTKCITCCNGTSWRCWVKTSIPYPCGTLNRFIKLCVEGAMGVTYQEKGVDNVRGWRAYVGGSLSNSPSANPNNNKEVEQTNLITAESMLRRGESRKSLNGLYRLTLQEDGDVVLYKAASPIWKSNTRGQDIDAFKVQEDGNLVAYATGGIPKWSTGTHGKENHSTVLVVQDDGNLVLYQDGDNARWASGTSNVITQDELNQSALKAEYQDLRVDRAITSVNYKYKLILQGDGNVVLYKGSSYPIWSTSTMGRGVNVFKLQGDGNIVAYRGNWNPTWSSGTNGKAGYDAVLLLQHDGDLVLYKSLERFTSSAGITLFRGKDPIWSTNTSGK